jgi:hypothetical protein
LPEHSHRKHAPWVKYTNEEYGFSFWYSSAYKPIKDEERCRDNEFFKCFLWQQQGDDSENWIVVTIRTQEPFHVFPNHGDVMPSKKIIGKHVFYYGLAGSQAVGVSHQCVFNLRNRTLEFGMAESGPSDDTSPLDPEILPSLRVTKLRPK